MKQLTNIINPLGQEKLFYYDLGKNLARTVDAKGQTIDYTYDEVKRLIQKQLPDNLYTYTYDLVDNLTRLAENDSELDFAYDLASRLLTQNSQLATISYTYDKNGNRLTMTDPQGGATNYTYDTLNRLTSLINPQSQTTSFSYDQLSRRTSLALPNGITTSYTYDPASQLLSITNNQLPVTSYQYIYDDVGNRLSMTDPDGLHNYTYDVLNRLTQTTHPTIPTESFNYDSVGNRQGASYDAGNRLLEDNDFSYTYDANGNLTSKTNNSTLETTTYGYDSENQLTRIDFPDGTYAAYRYDGLGRRIEKDVNGTITRYVYDNEDILQELDTQNSILATYIHGPGIDEPISMNRAGQTYFYHADGLGSIRELSDSTGAVVQSYKYDSFGNIKKILNEVGNPIPIEDGITNSYTFTGREYDPESGLYYYRARYYDPKIGRFLQEDLVRGLFHFPQSINLYPYVHNNPVNWVDPWGLKCKKSFGERWWENVKITNEAIPGLAAPTGLGVLTAGKMAEAVGGVTLGQFVSGGLSGATMGSATFTSLETGIIASSVAAMNFIAVGGAFEIGVGIGSLINVAITPCEEEDPCNGK